MSDDRQVILTYKGVEITCYRGSQWAYIKDREDLGGRSVFISVLAAKRYITKRLEVLNEQN